MGALPSRFIHKLSIGPKAALPGTSTSTLSKNAELRGVLFRYLDGFPIAPTISALERHSVLGMFRARQTLELADIVRRSGGNEGYLQVALRLLCSQGWLVQSVDSRTDTIRYTTTRHTSHAFAYAGAYSDIVAFLPVAVRMDDYLFGDLHVDGALDLGTIVEPCPPHYRVGEVVLE